MQEFKGLITIEKSVKIQLESISTDFEKGLMNAIKALFPDVRVRGCLFHYVKAIRQAMGKFGLLKKNFITPHF